MNSNTFHTTFNLWSSKSFTLVFNIFWNFTSYNVRNSKVMSLLHHASLQLNQPLNLLTVRVKIFQVALLYLLAKKSSCALICSSVKNFFINETKENDLQLFCIIPPHEFCPCYGSCREVDKFFSIVPKRRSIDTWNVVNFFHPMTFENFLSPRSCRDCFWIITSSSINISKINATSSLFCLVSFAPLTFK